MRSIIALSAILPAHESMASPCSSFSILRHQPNAPPTCLQVWRPPTQTTDPKGFAIHLLHIPESHLGQLQGAANTLTPTKQRMSKTDIAGALYWLLRCQLDGKPLPGTSPDSPRLYVTVDL